METHEPSRLVLKDEVYLRITNPGHGGEREVVQRRRASCGLWNDVINVEGCFLRELGKKTVFAAIVGALDDGLAQVVRNRHAAIRFFCLSARSGGVAMREGRLSQPSLQLRDVPRPSRLDRNPACRAIREDAARHLPGGAVAPSRQAFRLQTEWSEAYARYSTQQNVTTFNISTQAKHERRQRIFNP